MATIETLLTAEEYLALPDNGCPTELVRGKVIPMNVPGFHHGELCAGVAGPLWQFAKQRQLGHVITNDSGVVTERGPDTVRGPDVSFYSYSRVPKGVSPAGYPNAVPEVAVEVRSPTDRWPKVLAKVSEYLDAGVDLVYVVDAQSRTVFAYTADQPGTPLGLGAEMTFPPPLDGLRIAVRDVFEP
ncbi:MAG TPA: Uma2 family endonuclease [Pirellulales bacterium]|nr:Uma2 family endonuclease [Pirellulales bacterium]HVA49486.1 Uma2 family endonuclease [Pirellulales bacterium]